MISFWQGFEKQAGWKTNLALLGAGAGTAYGANKFIGRQVEDIKREVRAGIRSIPANKQALWSEIKEDHGLTGVSVGSDPYGYIEAWMTYEDRSGA